MANEQKIQDLKRKAQAKRQTIARAIGIDGDFRQLQLVYNKPSDVIVIAVERISSETFDRRIYFRHTSETRYSQLGAPSLEVHYSDIITSGSRPDVYYRVSRVTKSSTPGEFGGQWLSVERFDLAQHTSKSVITSNDLILPEGYASGWVSQLHGVSPDDTKLFCSCGLQRRSDGEVVHWLCGVELGVRRVTLISRLEGIWY